MTVLDRTPGPGWARAPLLGVVGGALLATAPWWPWCLTSGTRGEITLAGGTMAAASVGLWLAWRRLRAADGSVRAYAATVVAFALLGLLVWSWLVTGLLGAIDRGKQKRTMGDMRTLATALESYNIDFTMYPRMDGGAAALAPALEPTYAKRAPRLDAWGNAFEVVVQPRSYRIVSRGLCGEPDRPEMHVEPNGGTTDFRADIVFENGAFVQFPDGTQR